MQIDFYGADWCADCRRSKGLLTNLKITFNYHDVSTSPEATRKAKELSGRTNIPVIRFEDGLVLVEPTNPELVDALTLRKLI